MIRYGAYSPDTVRQFPFASATTPTSSAGSKKQTVATPVSPPS